MQRWPEPDAGDIVWCRFPDLIHAQPKPKPALVIDVQMDNADLIFCERGLWYESKIKPDL